MPPDYDGSAPVLETDRAPAQPAGQPGLRRVPAWLARMLGIERRGAPRWQPQSGLVQVGGVLLKVADVSATGLRIQGYRGSLSPQDRFALTLYLADATGRLELEAEAIVGWRSGDKLGAAFYGLSREDRVRLEAFLAAVDGT